ncbi:MAG: 30S ribosomal protein S18 [Cyanobium sp. MAG06]|nr:30S ribosomal protein S18 [Cyanobium sp. MAG06]
MNNNETNNNQSVIDYKNIALLKRYINPNGRILSRKRTGLSASKQRNLSNSIKRARFMGLLPYIISK